MQQPDILPVWNAAFLQVFCGEINCEASTETQKTTSVIKLICLTNDEQTNQRKLLKLVTRKTPTNIHEKPMDTLQKLQPHALNIGLKTSQNGHEHTHHSVYSHMCSLSRQLLCSRSRHQIVYWRFKQSSLRLSVDSFTVQIRMFLLAERLN